MRESDLQQVNGLISRAFTQGRVDDGYAYTDVPMCRTEFINMYLGQCPDGCFVFEESGQIRGAAFCHLWGKTGWFGPLAVVPERHHLGLGKQLLAACIDYLKRSGCTTIGLETNPRSSRNLGFYGKFGFIPAALSVDMIKAVPTATVSLQNHPHQTFYYSKLSKDDKSEFRLHVGNLMQLLGLATDYSNLIDAVDSYKVGETLLFIRKNTPVGFAVMQTRPSLAEEQNEFLRMIAFAAHPQTPDPYIPYFLADLMAFAQTTSLDRILLRVPVYSSRLYKLLPANQYRVVGSDLRMTLEGFAEKPDIASLHINRWV
jgi:GNAT superfamily N-acetyltransferase